MPKITEISFKNYRAFWGNDNRLEIKEKNALIYGENGSGKSSLYQGLKDLFRAADVNWTPEESPKHLKADNQSNCQVKIIFDEDDKNPIIFEDGKTVDDKRIAQTFLLNSFLSYKEMLRTHFLEVEDLFEEKKISFEEKLFVFLTQTLLNKHEIGDSTVETSLKEIRRLRKSRKSEDKMRLQSLFENFSVLFPKELEKISEQSERILKFFSRDLAIKLEPQPFSLVKGKVSGGVKLKIDYIGIEGVNHLEILNEARLSALAISICLAAIVTNPIVHKAAYKILFLDDVFIGLDTSNRLPLLEILQRFSLDGAKPFFQDFQIFITTYDRYWFELAQKNLGGSWTTAEMFVGEVKKNGHKLFDKPVIIQEQLEPLEKAIKFYETFDYYSAGNYLRKALEKELEKLVDEVYAREAKDLEAMISKLFSYYDDCDCKDLISEELRLQLKMFKDSVLNPSSHYDPNCPLYKGEIETTVAMLKKLQKLPKIQRTPIAHRKSSLLYQNAEKGYRAEYVLRGEVYAVKIPDNPPRIVDASHSIFSWSVNSQEFAKADGGVYSSDEIKSAKEATIKLAKRSEKIKHFLNLPVAPDWRNFTDRDGKTLTQLADEL